MQHLDINELALNHAAPVDPVQRPSAAARRRPTGFTLVELLLALGITAMVGVAISIALDAGFMAYGTVAQRSDMQEAGRLTLRGLSSSIRTALWHDAYDPNNGALALLPPGHPNHPVHSPGVELGTPGGPVVRIWWDANASYADPDLGDLFYSRDGGAAEIVLDRVRIQRDANGQAYAFTLASRDSDAGLLLARATIDFTVEPGGDSSTDLEQVTSTAAPLRHVASVAPRRNLD